MKYIYIEFGSNFFEKPVKEPILMAIDKKTKNPKTDKNYQIYKYLKYALVIARFRVQYGQYFLSFSYFADLFHEPLGE